uniref:Uncharacterized protein n=1 Tax=Heterosigma akashiwo TaxID=2829 RepID=A0A6V1KN18_HETAK|mmetsp:Transcript_43128/g.74754  ORF Transcript_43128/g.74754 Transcript_43128/m.74754 type:complete len:281 (-) Transcript_43128:124-966(-)
MLRKVTTVLSDHPGLKKLQERAARDKKEIARFTWDWHAWNFAGALVPAGVLWAFLHHVYRKSERERLEVVAKDEEKRRDQDIKEIKMKETQDSVDDIKVVLKTMSKRISSLEQALQEDVGRLETTPLQEKGAGAKPCEDSLVFSLSKVQRPVFHQATSLSKWLDGVDAPGDHNGQATEVPSRKTMGGGFSAYLHPKINEVVLLLEECRPVKALGRIFTRFWSNSPAAIDDGGGENSLSQPKTNSHQASSSGQDSFANSNQQQLNQAVYASRIAVRRRPEM